MTHDDRVKAAAEAGNCRPAFEAWCFRNDIDVARWSIDGGYVQDRTAELWTAWKGGRVWADSNRHLYDATRPPLDPATVEACEKVCEERAKEHDRKISQIESGELPMWLVAAKQEADHCASAIRALATTPGEERS